ncbi:MAG: Rieske 2Fe-2S domain-containing protein [Hyphomonadaceae bacterium]|nr:Rieske 2Fe-2S domain-containing protein [Hyphomonadaceae bacterium]
MKHAVEIDLIDEVLALKSAGSAFLNAAPTQSPADRYVSKDRFRQEQVRIFIKLPGIVAHVSELANPCDFITREVAGRSILITRDKGGQVNAFVNACRHRGTRLVGDGQGSKRHFSCPYHAWTYANTGELISAPHFDRGFPGCDKSSLNLVRLHAREAFGFIWVTVNPDENFDFDAFFEDIAYDLESLHMADMDIKVQNTQLRYANWKILIEGGIESYHFKIAHKSTIGPFFEDNLSTCKMLGTHMRSVLPRSTIGDLKNQPRDRWRLRDHANVLYTLFPGCQILAQQDHVVWISIRPQSVGRTEVRLATMAPKNADQSQDYWQKNHTITTETLNEDFSIGESVQNNAETGAVTTMLFGWFESALDTFNRRVEACLDRPSCR